MKTSPFRLPENSSPRERFTFRMAVAFLVLTLVTISFIAFFAIKTQSWQLWADAAFIAGLIASQVAALFLIQRGRQEPAVWLLFIPWLFGLILASATVSGLGPILLAAAVTITVLTGWQILPPHKANMLSILGVLMGVAALLIDLLIPIKRIVIPGFQNTLVFMLSVIVAAFGYLVIRQFRSFYMSTKLVIAFLTVTIVPLVIISIITYNSSRTALTNDANQKLASAATTSAADIDAFIEVNLESVRAAAQVPSVLDYFALPASQRAGSSEEDRLQKFITAISRQDPVFISSVAVYDTNGITVADTYSSDIGSDKSSRTYFQRTLQSGLPYASDVEYSATSGVPSIYFAAPIHDATGKVIGLIRTRYAASILQKYIIADTGLAGESSYAVLLNSNHVRLAHGSDRDRVFKSIVPLDAALVADLQSKGLLPKGTPQELSTNLPDFENGLNNLSNTPFFAADTNNDGALEQATAANLTTKDWSVAFVQSQSVFLAPIAAQTFNNLLAALIVATVVGVAGFFFSQTLSGPVVRLTKTAQAIAEGDINIQAKVETGDEIGTLADTFNRMTQQLRDFIANLEERVAARTKDLATVAEVGTATATILEPDRLLQEVVDLTKERFQLYHSHIYLLDEKRENLVLAAGAGEPGRQMKAKGQSIPLNREQSLVARSARERKGVTVNDVTKAPDFLPNQLLPNTRSELAVPMITGGNVIGVFDIQSDQVGRFTDSDVNIQTTLASQIATSVQNARSYEQSRSQAELETLVNTIGQKIQRTTTVEDTLQTAIRELGLAIGATRVKAVIAGKQNNGNEN